MPKDNEAWREFCRAVGRICVHNQALIGAIGEVRNWYVYGKCKAPERNDRLSERLYCERNSASMLLENLISAAKLVGRGNFTDHAVNQCLRVSSSKLLNELTDLANLLPASPRYSRCADALIIAVEKSRCVEDKISNFLMDVSGCGREISHEQWCVRLDKLLAELKREFEPIRYELIRIECLRSGEAEKRQKARAKFQKRPDRGADEAKRRDIAAIRKELLRRVRTKNANRIKKGLGNLTSKKEELKAMYNDFSWAKRCKQWPIGTLYIYVVRKRVT